MMVGDADGLRMDERFPQRVERARADVAIDDADRAERQRGKALFLDRRDACSRLGRMCGRGLVLRGQRHSQRPCVEESPAAQWQCRERPLSSFTRRVEPERRPFGTAPGKQAHMSCSGVPRFDLRQRRAHIALSFHFKKGVLPRSRGQPKPRRRPLARQAATCHLSLMDGLIPKLPIDEVLPNICAALSTRTRAVLTAPPGAGKSTRVPLALKDEPWAAGGKILLLEPRRLAARAAADRMAATLGEELGETVGLRMRLLSRVSAKTRIEVVTEGVFTRMILDDPALAGVAGVLFDEFHERSLDADFGLALALDASAHLREDLRLLVMSATLDGARVARLLGEEAPLIEAQGRMFPVATHYLGRDPNERIEDALARATLRALAAEPGSILVFLPGQGEIARLDTLLTDKIGDPAIEIMPLYSALDRAAQERAIEPTKPGRRKIVLATSIAETSLTIEGVRIVIDFGLARVPRYEPDRGLTRLETVRVSRAAADQRRGRAGRLEPGVCYRLWEEAATGALEPFAQPEILQSDLSGFLLDCAAWGARDPARDLAFLDPPPKPALNEAKALLLSLGALDDDGALTEEGRAIRKFALPPRLARMIVDAARMGEADLAAEVAVILTERGLGGDSTDLSSRIERFRKDRSQRAEDARRLVKNLLRQAGAQSRGGADVAHSGHYLASAFPDRIAMSRGKTGDFLLANGRAAHVEPHDPLARESFLAVGEIAGRAAAARILIAAPLTLKDIEEIAGDADQDQGRAEFRSAARSPSSAAAEAARRARARRTDAQLPRKCRRPQKCSPKASRNFLSTNCPGQKRSTNGATAFSFCARPKATTRGPIFPTMP